MSFALAYSIALPGTAEMELSPDIHVDELRALVYRLASPEFLGRRGPGAARTARHLADAFQRLGLKPAFGDSYFQDIPSLLNDGKNDIIGRNVGALLPGSDPKLKDEWIIISAHFDHLGKQGKVLYPGADDNATGVAMLLEVAEYFALSKEKPRRTIAFISFDQEETGLRGSMYFAAHSPLPFRQLKAFLTADMLGRSMANVMDEYVFVLGSERSTHLRQLIEKTPSPKGLTLGRLGADLIGTRSDYGPFRDRQVPFLFFSTGQHPDYHAPSDLPERIDYDKLQRISVYIRDVTKRLANDDAAPSWNDKPLPPDLDEIRTVAVLVNRVLKRQDLYPLPEKKRQLVQGVQKRLDTILEKGKVATEDRTWLMWNARLLLITVF
ncbi:MAG TPA: M20/M25/M40 family metallo-hydrolase [Gemmataceae bacterium]